MDFRLNQFAPPLPLLIEAPYSDTMLDVKLLQKVYRAELYPQMGWDVLQLDFQKSFNHHIALSLGLTANMRQRVWECLFTPSARVLASPCVSSPATSSPALGLILETQWSHPPDQV